jgi:allantoate deiminase
MDCRAEVMAMPTELPTSVDIEKLGTQAEAMIMALGAISAEPERLVRLFLTPEHRRAADLVATWMRGLGLEVSEDALGTVRGSLSAAGGSRRLLIGSHIDTVVDAGKYDGIFGIVAGILAAGHFAQNGRAPSFGVDVLAFGDEEGSRFPTTLNSSAAAAGLFDPRRLVQADKNGVTLQAAIETYGKNPQDIPAAAYRRGGTAAYVEVHIEQGPVLEAKNQPLGVVTAIVGQTYLNVEILGEAGHAGTVPMMLRRDALAGAAELIHLAEQLGRNQRADVVATVGRLNVQPNASNVIPAHAVFTLDVRATTDQARRDFVERFRAEARAAADRRQLGLTITQTRDTATTPCDPRLQDLFAAAITHVGGEPYRLGSGAGHDGQSMAKLCPVGMLFVRCRGGVSHSPMEYASPRDLGMAVAALIHFIDNFDPNVFPAA